MILLDAIVALPFWRSVCITSRPPYNEMALRIRQFATFMTAFAGLVVIRPPVFCVLVYKIKPVLDRPRIYVVIADFPCSLCLCS